MLQSLTEWLNEKRERTHKLHTEENLKKIYNSFKFMEYDTSAMENVGRG